MEQGQLRGGTTNAVHLDGRKPSGRGSSGTWQVARRLLRAVSMGFWEQVGNANNQATTASAIDAFAKAKTPATPAPNGARVPFGPVFDVASGALSLLGLIDDVSTMANEGVSAERSVSAAGNVAGTVSSIAGLLGASSVAGILGSLAGGVAVAQSSSAITKENEWAGKTNTEYETPGNADFVDGLADDGRRARKAVGGGAFGQVAGVWTMMQTLPIRALQVTGTGILGLAKNTLENGDKWVSNKPTYPGTGYRVIDGVSDGVRAGRSAANNGGAK